MDPRVLPALPQASPCWRCPEYVTAFWTLYGCAHGPCHVPPGNPALARSFCVFKEIMKSAMLKVYQTKIRGREKSMKTTSPEPVFPGHSPVEIQTHWQTWLK